MANTPATESELSLLHQAVTDNLISAVSSDECTAATLAVAIKFLKDNSITCQVEEDEKLSELDQLLKEKQKSRKRMQVGNVIDFPED